MSRLNKFIFNIFSSFNIHNETDQLSNEDIQCTFTDFKDNQIISCIDYFPNVSKGQCRVYSYPFTIRCYKSITNKFSGGLFECVRQVSLFDERPFEHEFLFRISQSFPFMEKLTLINDKPQSNKQNRKVKNDGQDLLIIEYPHLTYLNLNKAHHDYVEQFLVDMEICLPNNVCLIVSFEALKMVTENFTRDTTRINCAKLTSLCLLGSYKITKHIKNYFPQVTSF
ncbi:unnamed protein product [Rotaria sordida]|uniref:Uncharacterized protein n=1 Tax=Rotaria sordida TaxID=392033 RepID=A0A815FGP4_9BILA|nr:unnamed protein product [Rotaria sordida]CAF3949842.1 unnamed protein product [Rotaria sordida]